METSNVKKDLIHDLIQNIKEKKEARTAFIYSIFYFVFITLLLMFGHRAPAQTINTGQVNVKPVELQLDQTMHATPDHTIEILN